MIERIHQYTRALLRNPRSSNQSNNKKKRLNVNQPIKAHPRRLLNCNNFSIRFAKSTKLDCLMRHVDWFLNAITLSCNKISLAWFVDIQLR